MVLEKVLTGRDIEVMLALYKAPVLENHEDGQQLKVLPVASFPIQCFSGSGVG